MIARNLMQRMRCLRQNNKATEGDKRIIETMKDM